ncbi:hypothetical protein GQ44DRAFT_714161 [Phaeosphaeriaceae sp. PMI808]|nr:hypothetical protein GQ44DRAFT_714161 [Phaeosphaeriaceae sp. PMI808]
MRPAIPPPTIPIFLLFSTATKEALFFFDWRYETPSNHGPIISAISDICSLFLGWCLTATGVERPMSCDPEYACKQPPCTTFSGTIHTRRSGRDDRLIHDEPRSWCFALIPSMSQSP